MQCLESPLALRYHEMPGAEPGWSHFRPRPFARNGAQARLKAQMALLAAKMDAQSLPDFDKKCPQNTLHPRRSKLQRARLKPIAAKRVACRRARFLFCWRLVEACKLYNARSFRGKDKVLKFKSNLAEPSLQPKGCDVLGLPSLGTTP